MADAQSGSFNANGMKFSTPESDNDSYGGNCAADRQSGWWFNYCSVNCLTTAISIWTTGTPTWDVQFSRMLVRIN